jgi:hypothetical protein
MWNSWDDPRRSVQKIPLVELQWKDLDLKRRGIRIGGDRLLASR